MTTKPASGPLEPSAQTRAICVQALVRGEPIIIPTDTVYGLAALASDSAAIVRIFELKRRPADRSLAVLVADVDQAEQLAMIDRRSRSLVQAFWPGALTVVVDRRGSARTDLGASDGTIGLRSPSHGFVRELADEVGPIVATSANRHGEPTPSDAAGVAAAFAEDQVIVVDGGVLGGAPSTVVDARTDPFVVHRPGPVSTEDLQRVLSVLRCI